MVLLQRKLLFQGIGGGPTFSGVGSNFLQGEGVHMLISIEFHITCDFPGVRVWTPYPQSGSAQEWH